MRLPKRKVNPFNLLPPRKTKPTDIANELRLPERGRGGEDMASEAEITATMELDASKAPEVPQGKAPAPFMAKDPDDE